MEYLTVYLIALLVMCTFVSPRTLAASEERERSPFCVYEVNKKVREFPDKEDFSTPESTYAVVNRVMASGNEGAWRRISVKELAGRLPPENAERKEVKPEVAEQWLNARIVEVRVFRGIFAGVIAEITTGSEPPFYDLRSVGIEDGKWLNRGESIFDTAEQARTAFARACAYRYVGKPNRPKVKDPEAYLRPFVEFLKSKTEEPKGLVIRALAEHKVIIMGEIHHRPRYWAFNASLVTEPDFPKCIGTIYLELPSNDQDLVDDFLAVEDCNTAPVVEMLRDNLWMGWPDQAMLDFFITVWMVNQNLEPEHRIRIVLVDMQRPWQKIEKSEDWKKYDVDRDGFMAENILRDIRENPQEKRNSLFIVGVGHTGLDFKFFEGSPVTTAGWHLQKELGREEVYAIFQHRPVQTNMGRVDGRLCLGLFDSAFTAVGNREMAFPLDIGPFGKEPYDADPEEPVNSTYADGFSAYLYLGPLETEIFSPLIAGFYTDDFVKELDRRHRMMFGRGWAQAYRRDKTDAESFIAWMGNSWGKPRRSWRSETLGPMDAWHRGGRDWKQAIKDEKLARVVERPEEIKQAAKQLFDKIRNANYEQILRYYKDGRWKSNGWQKFPAWGYYMVHTDFPSFVLWCSKTFKDNPIVSVKVGEVFVGEKQIVGKTGWPTVPYKLTLKDGVVLEGNLPFQYIVNDVQKGHWHGMEGIDWHLQSKQP